MTRGRGREEARHKLGKMQKVDCNDEGCRCHLVALLRNTQSVYVH